MVVFLRFGHIAAGAMGGHGTFNCHLPWTGLSVIPIKVCPMGAVNIFCGICKPKCLSNARLFFFFFTLRTQYQVIVPFHLKQSGAALSFLSGCDIQGLYDLN